MQFYYPISGKLTHLIMTIGELLLCVYEFFRILLILSFGNHFCRSFDKPKDGAICMYLFYIVLLFIF